MELRSISTTNAPKAIGPYSQAIAAKGAKESGLIFCSGQLGIDPATGNLVEGVREQAERALKNLAAVLESEGLALDRIAKTTIFLVDMADFAVVNEVYATFFSGSFPARSTIQVAGLPKGGLVEIEAIAVR